MLFTKPGKKCSYLLPTSCHPSHISDNIPYSFIALRLKRICNDNVDFLNQLSLLKDKLVSRGYRYKSILCAFERVKKPARSTALRKREKKSVDRIALPHILSIFFRF